MGERDTAPKKSDETCIFTPSSPRYRSLSGDLRDQQSGAVRHAIALPHMKQAGGVHRSCGNYEERRTI